MGTDSITIPKDSKGEIFFLFTFSESDSVHIISGKGLTEETMISIPFTQLNRYIFLIKFYIDHYTDAEGKIFKLEARTWNDINLMKV